MNFASQWWSRSLDVLRKVTPAAPEGEGGTPSAQHRTLEQRLAATLRRGDEALAPHQLRRLHDDLQAAANERLSEVEAAKHALAVMQWYQAAPAAHRHDLWALVCEQFGPDAAKLEAARAQLSAATTPQAMGQAEMALRKALTSARTRLLQRFSVPEGGMRFLLDWRAELLALPKAEQQRFVALDAELEYLFAHWFDVAFLELRTLTWDSPASLLEKLIQYEAVHDIKSWADLKNRVDSDRRCYGFFHPKLPNEPLIFVEVALVPSMSESITPLLDEQGARADLHKATTAIFYSISNTQTGLRGVSFGNSLIKRVVDALLQELPQLRTFATLSPIPGLRGWLQRQGDVLLAQCTEREQAHMAAALGLARPLRMTDWLAAAGDALQWPVGSVQAKALMRFAAQYLGSTAANGRPVDAVARFHLGNGARLERLNWAADPSDKGVQQSLGLMVNYLYDLKRLDKHRDQLAQGQVPMSAQVQEWLKGG